MAISFLLLNFLRIYSLVFQMNWLYRENQIPNICTNIGYWKWVNYAFMAVTNQAKQWDHNMWQREKIDTLRRIICSFDSKKRTKERHTIFFQKSFTLKHKIYVLFIIYFFTHSCRSLLWATENKYIQWFFFLFCGGWEQFCIPLFFLNISIWKTWILNSWIRLRNRKTMSPTKMKRTKQNVISKS